MNRKKKITKAAAVLMLPIIIAISIFAGTLIETSQPDNPLLQKTDNAEIEANGSNTFGLSEDFMSNIVPTQINTDSSKKSDDSSSQLSPDSETSESIFDSQSDSKQDTHPADNQNQYIPSFPGTVNNSVNIGENNSQAPVNSGDSDNTASDISGDKRPPSGNKTDIVYFTTTIKDGEKINSRHYSFEIAHKQKKLKVKSRTISVNGEEQAQFNGKVFLSEGENRIRIEVTYTNENSKVISVYKDYKVFVDLGNIILNTDLTDRTVDTDKISFIASAQLDGEELPVTAKCNGSVIAISNGKYTAPLSEGENIITISAKWNQKETSKNFKVVCQPVKELAFNTNLTDCTVNNSSFSFTAYTQNGSNKAKLYITFNGTALPVSDNGQYAVSLNKGNNKIRLKATDTVNGKPIAINQTYTIKYVPIADENTAPSIQHINVTDGMTTKGSDFTLDIAPVDYQGNRIYHNGITVLLNGKECPYTWSSDITSYLLYLANGANVLDIRITDVDGRYSDYSYIINCIHVDDGDPLGEITISVDANVLGLGYIVEPMKITIRQGEPISYTIVKFLEEQGFTCHYSGELNKGFYLSRIFKTGIGSGAAIPDELKNIIDNNGYEWKEQHDDNSIGEFDYCQGSGWCFSVNDRFLSSGLSEAVLKDGDTLNMRFTLIYQKDIDGTYGKTWW